MSEEKTNSTPPPPPPAAGGGGGDAPSVIDDVAALAKGLGTTLGEFFRPSVTTMYPEEKTVRSERYRGRHYLRRYDNGLERCIGCAAGAAGVTVRTLDE